MSDAQLSTAEALLYDRQIRLWGIESQTKLRAANVLLIGVRGLGSEIAKNILLSGINSLTFLDDAVATQKELSTNFLLSIDSIGKKVAEAVVPKAQALNPLVKITADTENLSAKNEAYYSNFTIIVATGLKTEQMLYIDSLCRKFNVKFICGDVFGMFGFIMSDLLEHEYYVDQAYLSAPTKRSHKGEKVSQSTATVKVECKAQFPSFEEVLVTTENKIKETGGETKKRRNPLYYLLRVLIRFRDQNGRDPSTETVDEDLKKLKDIRLEVLDLYKINEEKLKEDSFELVFGEVAPICAVMGGVLAHEVIKAVSHKDAPINNLFLLDPYTYSGKMENVCLG